MAFDKYYLTKNVTWYFLMWNRYFTVNVPRRGKKILSTPKCNGSADERQDGLGTSPLQDGLFMIWGCQECREPDTPRCEAQSSMCQAVLSTFVSEGIAGSGAKPPVILEEWIELMRPL